MIIKVFLGVVGCLTRPLRAHDACVLLHNTSLLSCVKFFMVTHDVGTCFVSPMKLRITKILTPDFYNARVLRPPAFMISRVWGTRH